jgi:hypothetical protein
MTNLPPLPRVLKKQESKFSLYYAQWIAKNKRFASSIELKDTRGKNSLPFSEVKPEQLAWGLAISGDEGAWIRIQGTRGTRLYLGEEYACFYCYTLSPLFLSYFLRNVYHGNE